jgi:hypothetical protein
MKKTLFYDITGCIDPETMKKVRTPICAPMTIMPQGRITLDGRDYPMYEDEECRMIYLPTNVLNLSTNYSLIEKLYKEIKEKESCQ